MSDDPQKAEMKEVQVNGTTPASTENGTGPPTSALVVNGAPPPEPLTNGAVTRNKRVCRRKAAYKDDYTTKAANQIKSLTLKRTAAARATRIPKLPAKPCKAGTNVVVKAKVLQEVPEGLLVMSVQWRGKEYCGCFIDTNKQGWALPRFDDPKVSSIAFLTKKAQLLASDVDDSTDDDYSPKTKRKRGAKGKKNKKRKVKNGDSSNGKSVKTPTKSKAGRPSNADKVSRRQSTDTLVEKPEANSDKTAKSEKSIKPDAPEKPNVIKSDRKSASPEKESMKTEKPASTPERSAEKPSPSTSVIVKTEAAATPAPTKCPAPPPASSPALAPTSSAAGTPKQIRTEKTATIPVGTLSHSPLLKQPPIQKTLNSPFSTMTSPSPQINGALVSPLHNHSFPLMVPPPFFIPNFLQSAKFLAEGAKRTQSNDVANPHPTSLSGSDFNSLFAKNSVAANPSSGPSLMSDSQLRNKMT